jgi:hypothetical protein
VRDEWQLCPSAGLVPVLLGNYQAACPGCGWTFTTMMDRPLLVRHWVNEAGDVLISAVDP